MCAPSPTRSPKIPHAFAHPHSHQNYVHLRAHTHWQMKISHKHWCTIAVHSHTFDCAHTYQHGWTRLCMSKYKYTERICAAKITLTLTLNVFRWTKWLRGGGGKSIYLIGKKSVLRKGTGECGGSIICRPEQSHRCAFFMAMSCPSFTLPLPYLPFSNKYTPLSCCVFFLSFQSLFILVALSGQCEKFFACGECGRDWWKTKW